MIIINQKVIWMNTKIKMKNEKEREYILNLHLST